MWSIFCFSCLSLSKRLGNFKLAFQFWIFNLKLHWEGKEKRSKEQAKRDYVFNTWMPM